MRKSFYLAGLTVFFSILFLSCSDNSKTEKEIIKAMEESLNSSNKTINYSNQDILHALDEKRMDPLTSKRAKLWYPRAEEVAKLSKECYDYVERLKQNKISSKVSDSLYNRLKKYEADVLNIDPGIKSTFNDPTYSSLSNDSIIDGEKDFYYKFFKKSSKESINAFLTKLQNSIKIFENRTTIFCNKQVGSIIEDFNTYSVIIGQNSMEFKKGKELEIAAGVGSFSRIAKPEITINGKIIPLNESGFCIYKQKTSGIPGNYKLSVKIKYTDELGKQNIIDKIVTYSVVKECNQ